ncbi:hypothetical protein [Streptomyces sp. V1I6]|uniref:hypothetical protein n=1 Tax=Streptomyces sp. V1I6 TaxID=3042273 RepID=UPI00278A9DA6|nr:hypothetical protein [Streptomyces sp. V1I6]MDQ0846908.1 hypothetical protein [Streptomyces sp. V1I6]
MPAKAGTLVADHKGKPRLFRTDRLSQVNVIATAVRRRLGVELTQVWHDLRRDAEGRGGGVGIAVRLRRERLHMVTRIAGGYFTGPPVLEAGTDERLPVEVGYPVVEAVRHLLKAPRSRSSAPEARVEMTRAIAELAGSCGAALTPASVCPASRHGHPADTDASGGPAGLAGSVH